MLCNVHVGLFIEFCFLKMSYARFSVKQNVVDRAYVQGIQFYIVCDLDNATKSSFSHSLKFGKRVQNLQSNFGGISTSFYNVVQVCIQRIVIDSLHFFVSVHLVSS